MSRLPFALLLAIVGSLSMSATPLAAQQPPAAPPKPEPVKPRLLVEPGGPTAVTHWLEFLPDGKQLITAGKDKAIRIWDLADPAHPKLARTLRFAIGTGISGMIYSGALCPQSLAANRHLLAVGGMSPRNFIDHWGEIKLVELETGAIWGNLQGHTDGVTALAFSPDGRLLASGSLDNTIRIWNLADVIQTGMPNPARVKHLDEQTGPFTKIEAECQELKGHADEVNRLAFVPPLADADAAAKQRLRLVSAGDEGELRLWERGDDGQWKTAAVLKGHTDAVFYVACSPDGRWIASSSKDGTERLWDAKDGKFVRQIGKHGHGASGVAFTSDSKLIISAAGCGEDRTIASHVYDVMTGEVVATFDGHDNHVVGLAVSPRSDLVAAAGGDTNSILLWNPRTGKATGKIASAGHGTFAAAFSDDGRRVAFGTRNEGKPLQAVAPLEFTFDLMEVHPGEAFKKPPAAGLFDGLFGARPTEPGWQRALLTWQNLSATNGPMNTLTVYQADPALPLKPSVQQFEISRGQTHDAIHCYGFVPPREMVDGEPRLVVGSEYNLTLHDATTGDTVRKFLGHEGIVWSLAVSPDGRFLLSGSEDQTFRLWSLEGLSQPMTLAGLLVEKAKDELAVTFLVTGYPAEKVGVKVGDIVLEVDGQPAKSAEQILGVTLRKKPGEETLFKLRRNGEELSIKVPGKRFRLTDYVDPLLSVYVGSDGEWVAWTPEGYYKASPEGDKIIGWQVNRGFDQPAEFFSAWQFKRRFNRPDVLERVLETGDVAKAFEAAEDERAKLLVRAERQKFLDIEKDLPKLTPPTVTVIEPRDGQAIRGDKVLVRARVEWRSQAAANPELHVRLDDRPVEGGVKRGIDPVEADLPVAKSRGEVGKLLEMEIPLALAGHHKLEIFARTDDATSQPVTVFLDRLMSDNTPVKGSLHVLAIGVSQYRNSELNLGFAAADATGVAEAFQQQTGTLYENVEIQLLTDQQATRSAVLGALRKLAAQKLRPQDTAFILIAGHGVRNQLNDYYFATNDLVRDAIDDTAVPWSDFTRYLSKMQCRVILALDTCHSGDLARGWGFDSALGKEISDLTDVEGGVVVLTSSKGSESSLERADWQHGAFSLALIEALTSRRLYTGATRTLLPADYDNDGIVLLTELQTYLVGRVHELTNHTQNPTLRHSGTPFPVGWVK